METQNDKTEILVAYNHELKQIEITRILESEIPEKYLPNISEDEQDPYWHVVNGDWDVVIDDEIGLYTRK